MEETVIVVRRFPVVELKRLKQEAIRQGVGPHDGTVIRWAAVQYARELERREAAATDNQARDAN